jgi:hypothetical protein
MALFEGGEEGLPEGGLKAALDQRILDRFPELTKENLEKMMNVA